MSLAVLPATPSPAGPHWYGGLRTDCRFCLKGTHHHAYPSTHALHELEWRRVVALPETDTAMLSSFIIRIAHPAANHQKSVSANFLQKKTGTPSIKPCGSSSVSCSIRTTFPQSTTTPTRRFSACFLGRKNCHVLLPLADLLTEVRDRSQRSFLPPANGAARQFPGLHNKSAPSPQRPSISASR